MTGAQGSTGAQGATGSQGSTGAQGTTGSRNHDQMRKDAAARAAILAALERELKKGDKALVGNKGYRRFLMKPDVGHFAIDQAEAATAGDPKVCSSTRRLYCDERYLGVFGRRALRVHDAQWKGGATARRARPSP